MNIVFRKISYFLYCSLKTLATLRKTPNYPHGGRKPQVENH